MSKHRLGFYLLLAFLLAAMSVIPTKSQYWNQNNNNDEVLISGRNVNMVEGTVLPEGDPWLQRQNEPSIAVSTRNSLHLLAASNDYRTVDIPFTQGALPGLPIGTTAGDAWLGVFKSFDGGESWKSTLLPGYPQDTGSNSPLHLLGYNVTADPVVRADIDGGFYLSGIGFKRDATTKEIGESAVFVARYKDFNDIGDTIEYQSAEIVEEGDALSFIDKPWIAVDIPRTGASCGNVYIVYSIFFGSKSDLESMTSEIRVARSEDCGSSWSDPIALASASAEGYFQIAKKEKKGLFQGATIAIDPQDGTIYVAWRQFGKKEKDDDDEESDDAIYITMSDDGGVSFADPIEVEEKIDPFDQGTSGATFRTNSYPTIAVDGSGIVYLAWSERWGKKKSRIVISTSKDKKELEKWSEPKHVDNKGKGHQFMPSLAYAAGKLIVAWYDQREDISERFTEYIDDRTGEPRHTIDVRIAQADPGENPKFEPSIQVSRYLYVLTEDGMSLYQGQFNPPNFPLFQGGTAPFHGDYIDISPSPMFVWDEVNGEWRFNTQPSDTPPVFHIAWTDNRDVKPPPGPFYDWTGYTPPDYSNPAFDSTISPDCSLGEHRPGMRNQNIYTSRISQGLEVGSPRNSKPLDFPRVFVVFVNNTTDEVKSFRLTIANQPSGGQASFLQFEFLAELDVTVAPHSSISRPVFVGPSSDLDASIRIDVNEIDMPGGDLVLGGLSSFVVLNPGGVTAPDPIQYEEYNPVIEVMGIVDYQSDNPVLNPNIFNPNIFNPNIFNPNIFNTDIVTPNIFNPNIFNPNIFNPNIFNPNIFNPNIFNPNIFNPNIFNASLADADVFDVVWTVRNEGDATSSYVFKTFAKDSLPEGIYAQLLIYRSHSTPATDGVGCTLGEERHHELLANIVNPNIFNPNIFNPNIFNPNIFNASIENAAFSIPPGDEVYVALRLIEPEPGTVKFLQNGEIFDLSEFAESVGGGVAAQTVNIEDAQAGIRTPPADATNLVIGTVSLPDGTVGEEYGDASINYGDATLQAVGGTPPYTWSLNSGELPPGLNLDSVSGRIYGTPTADGTFYFVVQVGDTSGQTDTQSYSIIINLTAVPGPLTITTTSLPNGVEGSYYGATLEATGGQWPRRWSMASGSLPDGLSLDSGGVIGGRPSAEGIYNFTVRVTDAVGETDTQSLSIQILASTGITVTISGTVSTGVGTPVDGVLMRGLPGTPATDASGFYSDIVPQGWSGTVEPFKVGYSFTPESRSYDTVSANQTAQDYATMYIIEEWVISYNGPGNFSDGANAMTSDSSGNIYVTGASPKADTGFDCTTIKYNSSGTQLWVAKYEGPGNSTDNGIDIAVDPSGNVYVLAYSRESEKDHADAFDFITIKYDSDGDQQWVARYDNNNDADMPSAIEVDSTGVYVTGYSYGSGTGADYATIKYDKNTGNPLWTSLYGSEGVARYDGPANGFDRANAIAVDSTGVYVTGRSHESPTGADYATLKYDKNTGAQLWIKRYDGGINSTDGATAIAVDSTGVYVTGYSYGGDPSGENGGTDYDYATIKYEEVEGGVDQVWVARFDGSDVGVGSGDDTAHAIALDSSGNVFVTGQSYRPSVSNYDYATVKYGTTNGNLLAFARYDGGNGDDYAYAIVVDSSGYYVTGASDGGGTGLDYATVKWDMITNSQVWVARYNGPGNGDDWASAIASDSSGNVYVTGSSVGSGTGDDYATLKYNSSGVQQWVAQYNGPGNNNDEAVALAVDSSGNVYVTGRSIGSEYNRGPGYDIATAKYLGVNGNQEWVARYDVTSFWNHYPTAIAVDASGNTYITGYGFTELATRDDYITIKYDSSGNVVWVAIYDNGGDDRANAIAVDSTTGDVYVTGYSVGSNGADYVTIKYEEGEGGVIQAWVARYNNGPVNDEDVATAIALDSAGNVYVTGYITQSGTGKDYYTIKYDSLGAFGWGRAVNAPANGDDVATAMAVDSAGNVCVTGSTHDATAGKNYYTVKYDTFGTFQWGIGFNGTADGDDVPTAIALDTSGNVYVTGYTTGSGTGKDYYTVKYSSSGAFQWGRAINAPADGDDVANAMAVDSAGNVYVTGSTYDATAGKNYYTVKYNTTGAFQWGIGFNGTANGDDMATAIVVDSVGNVYVTGYSYGSGTDKDYVIIKYKQN